MSHGVSQHSHTHAPHAEGGMVIHWAARYDLLVHLLMMGRMRRFHSRIADLIQAKPGDAVLDVGSGPGDLALLLAERVGPGGMVAGIDASPEMIARARKKAQRRHLAVDFRLEPVQSLSFPDHQFDSVVSSFVYHHLPGADLKRQALSNIARVLKPGGQVCIVDFMPPAGYQGAGRMASDRQALVDLLRESGFTDIRSGDQLPSLGLLVHLQGTPPPGYVLACKAAEPGK